MCGCLIPNVLLPGEKTGSELLQFILEERQRKENEEKGKKARKLTLSIIEEEPLELPDGWCWCKIGDIADIERGGNFKKTDFVDSGYPCIHYGQIHMKFGARTYSVLSYLPATLASKQRKAHKGDIVMAVTSENIEDVCKCTAWLGEGDVAIGAHTAIIRHYINPIFLVYYFRSSLFYTQKKELGHGSKVVEVTPVTLNDVIMPLPPLSIQNAIVEKIEELFPIVDEYDKAAGELKALNEALPDKLRKSVLQEAIHGNLVPNEIPEGEATAQELLQQILKERQDRENKEKGKKAKKLTLSEIEEEPWELPEGWCWCKLSDLFNIVSARRVHQSDWRSSGIPFYRTREIGWLAENRTDVKPELYIDESLYARFKESGYPTAGDIMMTAVGTVGKTYIVKPEDKFYYKDASVLCLENFSKINSQYISYVIASDFFKSMIAEESMGTTVATITMVRANQYILPLPPLSIQKAIVAKIEEVFSAIDKLK